MSERFELPTAGEILTEEFLEPLNITPYRLSKDLGVSSSTVLDLVHGKRKITVEILCALQNILEQPQNFGLICRMSWICERLKSDWKKI